MHFLRASICIIFLLGNIGLYAQFSLQTSLGIENPYEYFYVVNVTPNSENSQARQKFNFFRTKIVSIGLNYDYTLPILDNHLILNIGTSVGHMNQFVADTIVSPSGTGLIYNAKHKNIFFAPQLGIKVVTYKLLSLTCGVDFFLPLRKWVSSEQGNITAINSYSEDFYRSTVYLSIGMEFDFKSIKVGLKYQSSGETDHWVIAYPLTDVYHEHDLERWLINIKYPINMLDTGKE